jgi:CheY-like chemotaxis protein
VLRLGVSDYLAKPLHPLHIVQRLTRFVETLTVHAATPPDGANPAGDAATTADTGGAGNARVEIVIADGDARFRGFVRNLLGNDYRLIEAETGAKALRRCLEATPALLLLGEELGAVTRPMIVRKLRAEQNLREMRIAAIVQPSRADAAQAEGLYDAILPRTLAASFKEQFLRVSKPLETWRGSGELVAGVRLQLTSTVEQVFGMMLGTEMTPQAEHAQIPGIWIQASVELRLLQEDLTFTVACSCPADTGTRIATQMQKVSNDWVGDDKAANALGDIATILTERIQRSLDEQGRKSTTSVASVRREPMKQSTPGQLLMLSFNAANGTLPFRVAVLGNPAQATAGSMAQAARNA